MRQKGFKRFNIVFDILAVAERIFKHHVFHLFNREMVYLLVQARVFCIWVIRYLGNFTRADSIFFMRVSPAILVFFCKKISVFVIQQNHLKAPLRT